ncbi:MAG: ATP-binding protein [Firmicutes bacterium]|jgi:anti-sigma regulatory factor (Ser/Thr protein kinase)|nr:ATP-binding protein [Bacillota bacterium]
MRELSLHLLDIVQNSIAAAADLIEIEIMEDFKSDRLSIKVTDNGRGMSRSVLQSVIDPFFTTRKTRSVGLGLSLFAQSAQRSGGDLVIRSKEGVGTEVEAVFQYSHIDRPPMGDLQGTLLTLIVLNPTIDLVYRHNYDGRDFVIDTREIKRELDGIPINQGQVVSWMQDFIQEGLAQLRGGRVE